MCNIHLVGTLNYIRMEVILVYLLLATCTAEEDCKIVIHCPENYEKMGVLSGPTFSFTWSLNSDNITSTANAATL